jgi:hypothetical protein
MGRIRTAAVIVGALLSLPPASCLTRHPSEASTKLLESLQGSVESSIKHRTPLSPGPIGLADRG